MHEAIYIVNMYEPSLVKPVDLVFMHGLGNRNLTTTQISIGIAFP